MKSLESMLAKAIRIASSEFEDSFDKGGSPYILHCLWVMDRVRHLGAKYMIVAVLHDLLEDTPWTKERLLEEGFSSEIVDAIVTMTHDEEEEPYEDYIQRISLNVISRAVKLRDLEHNSKITRLKGLRKKDIDRLYKYNKAYMYLSE